MYILAVNGKKPTNELIRKAFSLISEAVIEGDNIAEAHQWMAILMDRKSKLDGFQYRVQQVETVKKHMLRSQELSPEDPTTSYLLGHMSFGFADLPWYQRKIVSALLGAIPDSTYEEALGYLQRAVDSNVPYHYYSKNLVVLGECYLRLKNPEKAKEYLTKAVNIEVR